MASISQEKKAPDIPPSSNAMFLWHGFSGVEPRSFPTFGAVPIHQVAIGSRHCGFLTSQGQLYMYGNNQYGQLGLGNFENCLDEPRLVEQLADELICYVSCGARHSAAITVNGLVYCWGDSTEGQCGVNGIAITPIPQAVPINDHHPSCKHSSQESSSSAVKMLQVACGTSHTVSLSEYGEIWVWGTGVQLGLGTKSTARTPQRLEFLTGRRVLRVACGSEHTVVIIQKLKKNSKFYRQSSSIDAANNSDGKVKESDSDSPVENGVQQHRFRPSTCVKCKEEIYTYTETTDACIIESSHKCPLGLDVQSERTLISSRSTSSVSLNQVDEKKLLSESVSDFSDVLNRNGNTCLKKDNILKEESRYIKLDVNDLRDSTNGVHVMDNEVPKPTNHMEHVVSETANHTGSVVTDTSVSKNHDETAVDNLSSGVPKSAENESLQGKNSLATDSLTESKVPPSKPMKCVSRLGQDDIDSCQQVSSQNDKHSLVSLVNSNQKDSAEPEQLANHRPAPLSLVHSNLKDSLEAEQSDHHNHLSRITPGSKSKGKTSDVMLSEVNDPLSLKGPESLENVDITRLHSSRSGGFKQQGGDSLIDGEAVGAALDMELRHPESTASSLIDTDTHMETSLTENSHSSLPNIPKSRSTFLNENQAKEFLQKHLSGTAEDSTKSAKSPPTRQWSASSQKSTTGSPPTSPFVKKMENILQLVPAPPAAMQEYVTNLTKSVVTNIKTSIDKFGFVGGMMEDETTEGNSQTEAGVRKDGELTTAEDLDRVATFERYGTLPKSTSLGPNAYRVSGKSGHSRKSSLPSGMLETLRDERLLGWLGEEITLETEVWSWGKGGKGQLGHGDLLDRLQPCVVNRLNDQRVIKVVCGANHSLALTASCSMFSWGSNSHNQISTTEDVVPSPTKTMVQGGAMVWDVAAGETHSVVLCDCTGFCPDVFFSGHNPGAEEKSPFYKTNQFTRIGVLRKVKRGWMSSVTAGGDLCGCLLESHDHGMAAILHEFAVTERFYYSQLDLVASTFLRPLLQDEGFRSAHGTALGASMQLLVESFCHLADSVAINHLQLTRVIAGKLTWDKVKILSKTDRTLSIFQMYAKYFGDVLAMAGFDQCVKQAKSFFDKVQSKFVLVVEEKRVDRATIGATFRRTLQLPFKRLKEYSKLVGKLALKFPAYSSEHCCLTQITQSWDALRRSTTSDHTLAENTRAFWQGTGYKYAESLKGSGRRLLRDSKKFSIHLHAAKRFSSHVFLLFTDVFVHVQYSTPQVYPLVTVWVDTTPDTDSLKHAIVLLTPEDKITLVASSASEKGEWLWAINQAINNALSEKKNLTRPAPLSPGRGIAPPHDRQAHHLFMKAGLYKDAKYQGMWRRGKMHGHGELGWADGRHYMGSFRDGQLDGLGVMTTPSADNTSQEKYEGHWKNGKPHGLGSLLYSNGDHYRGYFAEGKRCGHGVFKQGKLTSDCSLASIYVGEWLNDKRHGYGVQEHLNQGEKYMGMWMDDNRHGKGIIVTLDGIYFEGHFAYHKITGSGLLMTEDNTFYEGQFSGGTTLYGKGTLTMPNGDYIEGTFHGSFADGVKVTGTFHKNSQPLTEHKGFTHAMGLLPRSFGQFSVESDRKWEDIFQHCYTMLGCSDTTLSPSAVSRHAWEKIASMLASAKSNLTADFLDGSPQRVASRLESSHDDLELIPVHNVGRLTMQSFQRIQQYLSKALETPVHPLGKLVEGLVDVYRATYVGVGSHPRLLEHAVDEAKSYVRRIYPIIRVLFPELPEGNDAQLIFSESKEEDGDEDDSQCEVVSPAGLIHSLLLPKIYPPLFTLYALYNEREDEKYWRRVRYWNKQPDIALLAYLGVEHTSFCPADKLHLIQQTFDEVNKVVQSRLQSDYLWSMDDLFPVFLYVVIRARIQHLGAEIHFIDDLMERYLEFGELGIMFTTLKACYFQIQQEKLL